MAVEDGENQEVLVALLVDDDQDISNLVDKADYGIQEEQSEDDIVIQQEDEEDINDQDDTVVTSFIQRREQSFSRPKLKKSYILFCIIFILSLSIATLGLLESPLYQVKHIKVTNKSDIPFSYMENLQIKSYVDTLKDKPMYRLDSPSVIKELEKIPTIRDVTISKQWPRSINVSIVRRLPRAYLDTDRGFVLVDNEGFLYQKIATAPTNIPILEGMQEATFTQKLKDTTYIKIINQAPKEIQLQISRISFDGSSYSVGLSDGINITLGEGTQLKEKLAIAWSIMNTKKRSDLAYIDVSVPSLPISGSPQLKV